jgi:hypothetical protein
MVSVPVPTGPDVGVPLVGVLALTVSPALRVTPPANVFPPLAKARRPPPFLTKPPFATAPSRNRVGDALVTVIVRTPPPRSIPPVLPWFSVMLFVLPTEKSPPITTALASCLAPLVD